MSPLPVVQYVGKDDGEEAEEERCSAGVHHRVEHVHRNRNQTWVIWHLLK